MAPDKTIDRESAFGMARLGFAYLQAAHALQDAELSFPQPRPGLLCQSIELLLKPWLKTHG
jgi:hypothetical protein